MGEGRGGKEGKSQTTTDLNVALIRMACTRREGYKPRNVLFFCLFFRAALAALTPSSFTLFPLFVPLLFMSQVSPPSQFLLFLSLFSFHFLTAEAQCLCIKITRGSGLTAREENKVTVEWKKE